MDRCPQCRRDVAPESRKCPHCEAELKAGSWANTPEWQLQVLDLLDRGEKLNAVKLYKEHSGLTLLEAKKAVEALARGEAMPSSSFNQPEACIDSATESELVRLLGRGEKLEAIKLYRKVTGSGLKDSKEAVEAFAVGHGLEVPGSGCLSVLLLIAVFVVLAVVSWLG